MPKIISQRPSNTIFIKKKHISTLLKAGAEADWTKTNERVKNQLKFIDNRMKKIVGTDKAGLRELDLLRLQKQILSRNILESFADKWEKITKKIDELAMYEAQTKQFGLTKFHYYNSEVMVANTKGEEKTIKGGIIEINNAYSVTTNLTLGSSPSTATISLENPNHILYDDVLLPLTDEEKKEINSYNEQFIRVLRGGTGKLIFEPQDSVYIWLSSEELDITKTVSEDYERSAFKGLVNSVTDAYDADSGRYTITIELSDVSKWLDFQVINTKPAVVQVVGPLMDPISKGSKNDQGQELITGDSIEKGAWKSGVASATWAKSDQQSTSSLWPLLIYSNTLAGIDARNIISLLVTGDLNNDGQAIATGKALKENEISPEMVAELRELKSMQLRVALKSDEVKRLKELEDKITPTLLRIGDEIKAQNIKLGNFLKALVKPELMLASKKDIRTNQDYNYLIMFTDPRKAIPAYAMMFGADWNMWDNEYQSAAEICRQVAAILDFEFYCDEQGNIRFTFPGYNAAPKQFYSSVMLNILSMYQGINKIDWSSEELKNIADELNVNYNASTTDDELVEGIQEKSKLVYTELESGWNRSHIIKDDDIISWRFTHSDINAYCHVSVAGQSDFVNLNEVSSQMIWGAATDYDIWWDYGFKIVDLIKPFLKDSIACEKYALAYLARKRGEILVGSITVRGDSKYKLRDIVYIESRGMLYYVVGVSHTFNYGSGYQTDLTLGYGRRPGELIPNPFDLIENSKDIISEQVPLMVQPKEEAPTPKEVPAKTPPAGTPKK